MRMMMISLIISQHETLLFLDKVMCHVIVIKRVGINSLLFFVQMRIPWGIIIMIYSSFRLIIISIPWGNRRRS